MYFAHVSNSLSAVVRRLSVCFVVGVRCRLSPQAVHLVRRSQQLRNQLTMSLIPRAPSAVRSGTCQAFRYCRSREFAGGESNACRRAESNQRRDRLGQWGFRNRFGRCLSHGWPRRRRILAEHNARMDIFAATMLGQIDIVSAAVAAFPNIVHVPGPHGIPLIVHAEKGGPAAKAVLEFLRPLAGQPQSQR